MVASKRDARESKKRVAQMEAKRVLREAQGKRRLRDNVIGAVVAVLLIALAVVLQLTVFSTNPTPAQYDAAQAGLKETPSASPSASSSPSVSLPPAPNPSVAAGKTFTGTLDLNKQPLSVELDGTKAPQAAAVFKTLADSGFFANKTCHRLTTEGIFVLQCGSADGKGGGVPTFTWGPVENAPADNIYPAGTIAVARAGDNANSNGTQFFITYKDSTIPSDSAGGYAVVGKVTNGIDVVNQIAAAGVSGGKTDGPPTTPVTIDSFTLN
ncbi:peptidyl-prolyl cis-trans isomerase [Renibacterium salmoninarum ATCC 33209]|uniref:peptidylprolyl isomerase n=1 Tax=Renibacterium salmoninarum (strain ATCC 33209 / DSM 20767 / JCM 11484 / NBRC 15589 / NCIMB 2235) TaxID=288705 RepID=A9WSD7_RENSM|nr:peptidylprolyl isomerase [Renibacterium salmoninarum]ABY23725.1 peptidyl-prolyl cis-trans isomerase [Renibacterium salmoninarum ATCC 33209]